MKPGFPEIENTIKAELHQDFNALRIIDHLLGNTFFSDANDVSVEEFREQVNLIIEGVKSSIKLFRDQNKSKMDIQVLEGFLSFVESLDHQNTAKEDVPGKIESLRNLRKILSVEFGRSL